MRCHPAPSAGPTVNTDSPGGYPFGFGYGVGEGATSWLKKQVDGDDDPPDPADVWVTPPQVDGTTITAMATPVAPRTPTLGA